MKRDSTSLTLLWIMGKVDGETKMDDSMAQVILGGLVVAFVVLLLCLPGAIASKRKHPNATAIWICGFLIWPVALIWSFTGKQKDENEKKVEDLQAEVNAAKVTALEKELARLKA